MEWFCLVFIVSLVFFAMTAATESNPRLPIIYVFTVVPAVCQYGLPSYIIVSLEQAVLTQPDCDVIMASNYAACPKISEVIDSIPGVIKIDIDEKISSRTKTFKNQSLEMFIVDGGAELWLTSAYRFFYLEDLMIHHGLHEVMHVEADNTLYGKVSQLLPVLRTQYAGLAATPLNDNLSFITASVFWISSLSALRKFNDYLLDLGKRDVGWKAYLTWLRPYGCCKHGGIDVDAKGLGIKPFAVNEMSMLAFYHHIHPEEFKLFPITPTHAYFQSRHVCNMSQYSPHGDLTGGPTGDGVWDPNSWGQFMGGTATKRGRDRGFSDASHVAGQAIRTSHCRPHMLCANQSYFWPVKSKFQLSTLSNVNSTFEKHDAATKAHINHLLTDTSVSATGQCLTAPFVRCGDSGGEPWVPLWNLHVHSKHTHNFRSLPCECTGARR